MGATGWLPGAPVAQECGSGASGASLNVRTVTAVDIDRITVRNGLADVCPAKAGDSTVVSMTEIEFEKKS